MASANSEWVMLSRVGSAPAMIARVIMAVMDVPGAKRPPSLRSTAGVGRGSDAPRRTGRAVSGDVQEKFTAVLAAIRRGRIAPVPRRRRRSSRRADAPASRAGLAVDCRDAEQRLL
jgi:hypothetical protein